MVQDASQPSYISWMPIACVATTAASCMPDVLIKGDERSVGMQGWRLLALCKDRTRQLVGRFFDQTVGGH